MVPRRRPHLRYCSSLTFSIQSTFLPLRDSCTAMCVMAVVGEAPCQCFSPGGNHTTSPGRISSTGPLQRCARPAPAVTIRAWPSGCVCHAVRAPASNVTLAPATRAGAAASNSGSIRTVPINHSAGPLTEGCEPLRLMSITVPSSAGRSATSLRRSAPCKVPGGEFGNLVEWDLVQAVVQIDVICTGHNDQLLRLRRHLVDVFGVIAGVRLFTRYQQNRS